MRFPTALDYLLPEVADAQLRSIAQDCERLRCLVFGPASAEVTLAVWVVDTGRLDGGVMKPTEQKEIV